MNRPSEDCEVKRDACEKAWAEDVMELPIPATIGALKLAYIRAFYRGVESEAASVDKAKAGKG